MRGHINGKGDNEILGLRAEMQLLQELQFSPEDRWLRLLYECKANKVGVVDHEGTRRTPQAAHCLFTCRAQGMTVTIDANEIVPKE